MFVSELHQALLERGALPPEAAGEEHDQLYGPVTGGAVRSFQASSGLTVDGVVGPRTWAALEGEAPGMQQMPQPVPPLDLDEATAVGRMAVVIADAELRAGAAEVPPGSNRGPRVDLYLAGDQEDAPYLLHARQGSPAAADGWQGASWCGRFVRWCITRAVRQLAVGQLVTSPIAGWGDLASAWKWRDAARRAGAWRSAPAPGRVGVIVVEAERDRPAHGHVVLLAGPAAAGMVWTREGNSGDRVAARQRPVSGFAGFVEV